MNFEKNKKNLQKKNNLNGICKNSNCYACSKFLKKAKTCKIILVNTNDDKNEEKINIENKIEEYLCFNSLNNSFNNIIIND